MRVLVCGSRDWEDRPRIYNVLSRFNELYGPLTIVQGESRGADSLAKDCAVELGMTVESYPADWKTFGKAAGPIRNQQMLDTDPDVVIAFHDDVYSSKGTKDMIWRAKKKGTWYLVYQNSALMESPRTK